MVVKNYRYDNGRYRVYKWINHKCHYFGDYKTEKGAKDRVKQLRENNWEGLIGPKPRKTLFPFPEDEQLIDNIAMERMIKNKTKATYCQSVIHYTDYLNQSLTSLIELYYQEEESIPWKKRTLKKHLVGFRNHLYSTYLRGTAKNYFSRLLTLFRHLEIELSYLPKLNTKNINEPQPITHDDLLTKKELEKAYGIATPLMKCIILFQSSSGCARRETLNLTVNDFLEATSDYHGEGNIPEILTELIIQDDVVPTFKIKRQKTNKYYYTFCSPEATKAICAYLLGSGRRFDKGCNHHLLFKTNLDHLNKWFNELNEKVNAGQVADMNRIRSHMLRKFHASRLYNDGLSIDKIDALQGRAKDNTHKAYFKESPEKLRELYITHMGAVTIYG